MLKDEEIKQEYNHSSKHTQNQNVPQKDSDMWTEENKLGALSKF